MLEELDSLINKKEDRPTEIEAVFHFLATEAGLNLKELESLPMPYIVGLMRAQIYFKQKEKEVLNKNG